MTEIRAHSCRPNKPERRAAHTICSPVSSLSAFHPSQPFRVCVHADSRLYQGEPRSIRTPHRLYCGPRTFWSAFQRYSWTRPWWPAYPAIIARGFDGIARCP